MRKIFLLSCAAIGLLAFTSCEKCRTCDYTIKYPTSSIEEKVENCGKKKDLDNWEAKEKTAVEAQVPTGATLEWSCVED